MPFVPAILAWLAATTPWLMPWLPILGWGAAGTAVIGLLGVNWWLELVEWRTAAIFAGLMALTVFVTYALGPVMRALISCGFVVAALAWGTLDERQRQRDKAEFSRLAAEALAKAREEEFAAEQKKLEEEIDRIKREGAADPFAEREALSAEAVERINRLRGN